MYLGKRSKRFVASFVLLGGVLLPVAAAFFSPSLRAAGGTVGSGVCATTVSNTSTVSFNETSGRCVYTFTAGVNSFVPPTGAKKINFLVVGGGAGGGSNRGGGGGAGGFHESSWTYTSGSVDVVVGAGGAGGAIPTTNIGVAGTDGGTSSINGGGATFAAGGGGGGGAHGVGSANQAGRNGVAVPNGYTGPSGSGGGASMNYSDVGYAGGTATAGSGYANAGAASRSDLEPNRNTGGGGGAGGAGVSGSGGSCDATTGVTPAGGSGRSSSLSGSSITYAAGGGGADGRGATETCAGPDTSRLTSGRGLGGSGIGGNGAALGGAASSASANSGSGGGAGNSDSSVGGDGGSGVVILSVDVSKPVSNGTTTTDYLPKATNTVTVAYSATDTAALSSVAVFYSVASDLSSPTQCGSATGLSGTSATGNITCTLPSSPATTKTYYLYTVATDSSGLVEDIPGSADDSFVHDAVTPLSTPNIVAVATKTNVVSVDYTATDAVGLTSVKAYISLNSNFLGASLCGTATVAGTSASGSVSCTIPSPASGTTYYIYTVATDASGQAEATADQTPGDSILYDTAKPTFSNGPVANYFLKSTSSFTIQSDDTGSIYFVSSSATVTTEASITSLNDNQFNAVASAGAYTNTTVSAAGLPEGAYKIYAVDFAGNVSDPYAWNVTVDDTSPTKPTSLVIPGYGDTGLSNSDGIVNDTTPVLSVVTNETNGTVLFSATKSGTTTTCSGSVYANGSVGESTCTFTTLATGTWVVTAVHTDAAGNVSPVSDSFTMVIDTTVPTVPTAVDLVTDWDLGTSSTDNITSAPYPRFSTTFPETTGQADLKVVQGGITGYSCFYSNTDTDQYCALEPTNVNATGLVYSMFTDVAGNSSAWRTTGLSVTFDRTAPTLTNSALNAKYGGPQSVSGSSNEAGAIYVAPINVHSWYDLSGLATNSRKFTSQATANTSTAVPLSGLADYGSYALYAVDTAGNISSPSNTFEVDATGPNVTVVFGTDGRYKVGGIVDINVRFNEVVNVVGTPRLGLQGTIGGLVNYFNGSGTDTLTFRWTVPSGVNSSDLSLSGSFALDTGSTASATIKDAYGNAANFQTPSVGSGNTLQEQSNIIIDTTAPTFNWSTPSSSITNGTPVTYTLTASEEVNWPVPSNFTNGGTATGCSFAVNSQNSIVFTISVSGCADGTASPRLTALSVSDLVGNTGPSAATSAAGTTFDTVAPTITACTCAKASGVAGTSTSVTSNSAGTVYLVKSTITVTDIASITSASGDQWNSQTVTANSATNILATGLVEGSYKIYAVDLAGNLSAVWAGGTLTVDNVAPTVSVVGGTYGNSQVISTQSTEIGSVYLILQSVTVPSPMTADFLATSPLLSSKRLSAVIATANTPTNTNTIVTCCTQTGGIYDAYAVDAAGNVSPVLSGTVTVDITRPTLVSVVASSPNGLYLWGQTINIDVTFSEPMRATSAVTLSLETGATDRSVPYSSGSGTNVLRFVYTVQSGDNTSDLDVVASGGINGSNNLTDMYFNISSQVGGNFALPVGPSTAGSISNASDIVVDGIVPVVSSAVNTASGNQSSYSTTFTFSNDVTDFDLSDLTMGGTATGCTPSLSPTSASVYVVTYSGCSDGTITSTIRVDAVTFPSTNRGPKTAFTTSAITRDTTAPIITQSPVVTYFNTTSTVSFTVNGTSTVYLVNTANTVTDAASITALPSNQWKSFSYTTGTQSFNGTSLQDGLYKMYAVDIYGNMSTGTASSYLLDTVAPTVTLTSGTIPIGGSATLRSNDIGTLYLVKSTVSVTTIASITGAGVANYKSQAIATANTNQNISVSGLSDGTYYAYTADGGLNLSPVSTTSVIVDNTAPTVTNVTAGSANGNYKLGDVVLIDVLFNDIVNVSTTGGTPTLLLETGTTDRNATYVSGTGTTTLRFSYTVQEGDLSTDLNYQSTTALALGGGSIADVNGNNATLTLPALAGASSLSSRSAINVKGTRIAVSGLTATATPTTLSTLTYNFTFSETVYGLATTDFTFGGTATGCSVSSVGTPTTVATVTVTGCSDGTVILKLPALSVQDLYGTTGPAADYVASTITVDRTGPVPTFVLPSTPTNAASIVFTVNYNESMSGLAIADFTRSGTATGCSAGTVSAASGTSVTVTFTGCGEGTVMLRQNASTVTDALLNSGPATAVTSATVTIDRSKSTVSSFIPSRAMTNSSSSTFVLTMNEEVTGLASGDITYSGTATGCSFSPDATGGTVISITVTGCSTGTVIPKLLANGVTDLAGNTGPAADYIGSTLTIDRTAPSASATPNVVSGSDTGISSTDGKTNLTTLNVSATTPETTGTLTFTATSGSTTVTCAAPVSSSNGSCSLTGLSEGTWTISTVFTDAAGNDSVASATSTFTIDTTAPSVSIAVPTSPVRILPETFTLTFSEAINGLTSADFTNGGGTSSGCTFTPSASSGTVITVSVNNCGDGTLSLQVVANGVNDESGNTGPTVAEVAASVTIDNGPPTVTLTNARVKNTGNAVVRSTKPGAVYLVKSTVPVSVRTDITNAAGNTWNSVAVTNIDTDTALALTGLIDGTYYAYGTDAQNRLSVASSASFTVDNTAPSAPVSVVLAAASDRGVSSSDGITNISTPTVKVVASEAGGIVTVTASKSGQADVTCSMNASTTGSICDLGTLVDGTWILSATQTDIATNTSISTTTAVSIDSIAPSISGVSSNTVNGSKKVGASIDVRVTFDDTVNVDTTGGTPSLLLETGATDRTATYTSGSNSSVLVFTYAVQAGDASGDLDYNSATALTLNSAVITDTAGNTSTPILPTPGAAGSLGANKSIVIDTAAPSAPVSVALDSTSDSGASSSDGITNDATPTIKVVTAEANGTVMVTASKSGQTDVTCSMNASTTGSTCDLGVLIDGSWTLSATHTDVATNTSTSVSGSVEVDTVAATVSSVSSNTSNGAKKAGATVDVRVTFDSVINMNIAGGSPNLLMETGATDRSASYTSTSSPVVVFTYTVQAGDTSSDLDYNSTTAFALNGAVITDIAGNTSTPILPTPGVAGSLANGKAIVIDTSAPSAPVSVALDSTGDSGASSSDGITNDATPTIKVVTAEANGTVTVTASKSGQTDVTCSMNASSTGSTCDLGTLVDGTWTLAATHTDIAINASTSVSGGLEIDTVAAAVSSVASNTSNGAKKAGATVDVRVTFDSVINMNIVGGSPTMLMETGATDRIASYTSTSSPVVVFTYTVQAGDTSSDLDYASASAFALNGAVITDIAGNISTPILPTPGAAGSLAHAKAIIVDTASPNAPTLSAATIAASANASVQADEVTSAYLVNSSITVTSLSDITNANGALWNQVSIASINTATSFPAAGLSDGVYRAFVVDSAGNISSASSGSVTVDSTAPTVAITSSPSSVASGGTSTITFTLSETITGFASSDVSVGLGTLSNFSGSGLRFTATFTASSAAGGSAFITVDTAAFSDIAGNFNAQTTGSLTVESPVGTNGRESASTGGSNYIIEQFTTAGTYHWTVPSNVTSVEYIVIGGGGGGGGGGYVPSGNGGGGGGGAAGSLKMGTASVTPGTVLGIAVGTAGLGGTGGNPSMTFQPQGTTATGGGASSVFGIQSNGGYGGCASGLNASATSCGYLLITNGYGGYGGNNALADGGVRASILGGGGGGGAGSYGTGGNTSTSTGGAGGVGTAANFYGISDTFGTGGNGGPGAVGAVNGTNGTRRGNGGNGGGGGLNGSNAGSGGNGSDGFVAIRYAVPAVSTPDMDGSSDTGASSIDNLTRLTTPMFTGTAAMGATVQLYVDSTASGSPCIADLVTGVYNCTTGTLTNGTHTVSATSSIVLAGGETTSTSSTLTFEVDSTPPVPTLTTATLQWGEIATAKSNKLGTLYLVKDSITVTSLVDITLAANNVWNSASVSVINTDTTMGTSGLTSGEYKIYAVDIAGNIGTDIANKVTYFDDTTAPIPSLTSGRVRSVNSVVVSSNELGTIYLLKSTVSVNRLVDITNALSTVQTSVSVVTPNGNLNLPVAGLMEGTYYAYAVDRAGNFSNASSAEIVIDNTPPTVSSYQSNSTAYNVRTFSLTLDFSEAVTGLTSADFSNTGTASSCAFTPNNSSGTTFIVGVTCTSDGTVVARLASNSILDLAGNAGPSSTINAASVALGANPTKLVLTTSSVGTASGAAFTTQPAITLKNAQDLVVPYFPATVTASITPVNGTGVLVGTTSAAVDTSTGIATFSDLGISGRAGTQYTITYSSGSLTVATQNITVTVGAAVGLDVSMQPVGGASGALFATQPIVRVVDSGSNTVTTASVSVSVGTSTGTLGGTRPRVTASGVATFTDLTFSGLASQSHALSFTSTGLLSVVSSSFNVTVGTATQVVLTTQSVGTESGVAFTTQPVLEIRDSGGNKVATSSASVSASVGVGASLDGTKIVSASSGVAAYSNLGISGTAGTSYTITYSSPGLSPAVQAVTPTVGPATKLLIDTQPVGAGAGAALATQPVVHVVDSGSNIIMGSNATIVATPSAGTLGGTMTMNAASGEAAFSGLTFAGIAGTNYQLTFASVGLSSATSGNFTVSIGVATRLSITTQPVGATAGAQLATQPVVKVLDAGDNIVTGSSTSVGVSSSAGALGGTVTISAVNGVATYSNLTFAGTINTDYTLTFASVSITSAQSNNIRVTVGAAHKLALTTSATSAFYAQTFGVQPVVEVQDAGGNRTASTAVVTATLDNGTVLSGSGVSKTATAVSGVATFNGLGIIGAPSTYNITYSAASLQNATQSINVNKANQTISFTAPTDRVYSTVAFTLSGSSTSSLAVVYTSTTTSTCAVSSGSVTMVGIGTCSITASQVGNGNYNAASDVVRTFVISRATPVITFNTLSGKTYGDAVFNISATADVPVLLTFSGTSGVCSVGTPTLSSNTSTIAVTIVSAGTCTISVSRAQDANYEAAVMASGSSLMRSFNIAKAAGTIAFTQNTLSQTYNGSARIVTGASNTGTLSITYTGIAPTVYAPSTTPPVNAGSYAVVAVMNDTNYEFTAAETLTVAKAQGAITLDPNALVQLYSGTSRSAVVGSTTPSLAAVTVMYVGSQGTVYGPSQFAPTNAGSYAVTASLNDTNYQATTTGTLVVGLGVQSTISFISRSATDFDDPFSLLAVGGTGTGTMSYAAVSGPCTVEASSGLLTPTGTGACVVTATRGSSGNFGATSSAAFTVTINQAPQMVEFTSTVPSRPLPGNTYTPTAVSSSGLVPTFSITQGGGTVCTISSSIVTIVASGTCEVTVDQVGNSDWLAADSVTQTMVAGRLNQSITFAAVSTKSFGDPVFSLGATASSGRVVDYSVVTGATTCSVAAGGVVSLGVIGTCVVEASQAGDNVYLPAVSIRRSITVIPTVPSAPFLSSVSTNDGSVTVAYSAPSSDGGQPVQAYSIVVRFAGADRDLDVTRTDCPLTMSCYIDGLTNGRSYSVTVTAKNAVGAGASSATSPLILPVLNPQAVRGLTARAGNQIIDVAWTAPSNLGGGTFARYEISIRDRSGVYQSPISLTDQNSVSYQFASLDNGIGYDIKVVTITSAGTTEFTSNTAEVFEMPRTVPSAPRDVTIAAPTGRIARVSWRVPQTDGGAVITSYVTNVPGSVCVMTTPVDVVCEISGLTPGSPLSVEVRAVNSVGNSQPMTAAINLPTRPTPPSIRSVVVNASTAQAVWAPPVSDGGQAILGYLMFVRESGARVSSSALNLNDAQCVTAATTCQIEGLDPTKKYVFTVRAVNAVGESESSAPLDPFAKEVVAVDPSPATSTVVTPAINTPQKKETKPKKQKLTKPSTSGSTAQETVNTDDEDEVSPTTSVPTTTVPQNSSESGNNSGADRGLAGIAATVLFGLIFVAICWFVVVFARRRRRDEELPKQTIE